jgi:hypothetical protein
MSGESQQMDNSKHNCDVMSHNISFIELKGMDVRITSPYS